MITPDQYINNLANEQRSEFDKVQAEVLKKAPEAELVMSYGMPTFKYKGQVLIHFGAFKDHVSLFPASDDMVTTIGDELTPYRAAKGTLRFTPKAPIPTNLLKKIISYRINTITE